MTIITSDSRVRTRERPYSIMIKSGGRPGCLTVAFSACQRELLNCVIGISRLIVIICVTARTGIGWIDIVALVTIIAAHVYMGSQNWIERVVECGRRPGCLSVTICAVHGELLCNVIGVNGLVVVVRMTTSAGIGCIIVITVVAGSTVVRDSCMRPDQLIEVIVNGESSGSPSRVCSVAGFAGGGQIEGQVARVGTDCIIIRMAGCTGCWCAIVVSMVAFVAGNGRVRTRKRPVGMVVCSRCPVKLTMAVCTAYRKLLSHVIGILCQIVIINVATCACIGRICVIALMTIVTEQGGMGAFNWVKVMAKRRRCPYGLVVTVCTTGRELLSYVVGICCLVVVIRMATCAVRWCCSGSIVTLVTVVATHACMRAHDRVE